MEKSVLLQFLAIVNLIAFLAVLAVNGAANAIPLNGMSTGELSDFYPNLFVPAGITFAVWGIIYLLLAGFSIYSLRASFSKGIDALFISETAPWFIISCIANLCWIFAWHWKKIGLSLGFMLIILASLAIIYSRINQGSGEAGWKTTLFIKIPFSVYLGWITVATIANITALLVSLNWSGAGLSQQTWTIVVLAAAVIITCLIIFLRKDWAYALVIIWAFSGIILKRNATGDAPLIVLTAGIGIGIIAVFYIVKSLFIK